MQGGQIQSSLLSATENGLTPSIFIISKCCKVIFADGELFFVVDVFPNRTCCGGSGNSFKNYQYSDRRTILFTKEGRGGVFKDGFKELLI